MNGRSDQLLESHLLPTEQRDPGKFPNVTFTYIDIASVDQGTKSIVSPRTLLGSEASSRARKVVRAEDVLVSTVRPNLNAVALVPPELDGAICSTGFAVLRPVDSLLSKYLFGIVRSERFVATLAAQASGASYPAVTDRQVREVRFSIPPLDEQERIVKLLDEADALRKLRAEADRRMAELVPALFYEMFGDPVENPMGWPTSRLSEIVTDLVGGKNVNPTDEPESAYRVLKVSAVTSGTFRPEESKAVPETYVPPPHHFVQPGDLLFSRANTTELVGATSYVFEAPPGLLLPDKLWRFVWSGSKVVEPLFMWQLLQMKSMRRQLSRLSSGSGGAMKNISKAKLYLLQIPQPPLALQRHFGELVLSCREMQLQQRHVHLRQASLLASVFRTELS